MDQFITKVCYVVPDVKGIFSNGYVKFCKRRTLLSVFFNKFPKVFRKAVEQKTRDTLFYVCKTVVASNLCRRKKALTVFTQMC